MACLHCHSAQTTRLPRTIDLGYAVFGCIGCGRTFNERTGTPFSFLADPDAAGAVPCYTSFLHCAKTGSRTVFHVLRKKLLLLKRLG